MKIKRTIHDLIKDPVIANKMIVLAGPRQVGKTTLAKEWLKEKNNQELYFNWDSEDVRRRFRKDANFFESTGRAYGKGARIVFDEIHKQSNWKNIIKGYYDQFGDYFNFSITGSARLELFHRAGDSMLGRYHLLHMSLVTPNELAGNWSKVNTKLELSEDLFSKDALPQDMIDSLIKFSGFPEPLIGNSERGLNLWHQEYRQRIMRDDLRDLTKIMDFNRVEHLLELLPSRIGSPLSLNSLREDIACSHDTVKTLIGTLEKLYIATLIRPFNRNIKYSIAKEPKIYFYDWTLVPNSGAMFENFIAIQLKTFCEFVTDGGWANAELFYIRDKQKRETDFLITLDGSPMLLIEAKFDDSKLDSNLRFFSEQLENVTAVQVIQRNGVLSKIKDNIWIVSANRFFNLLWNFH